MTVKYKKCIVGMSGGVDSSVCAKLMQKISEEVIGCTLQMFDDDKTNASIEDAKRIANMLCIKHTVIDCREDFKKYVMDYFVNSYKNGQTPNPCVVCNSMVKFNYLNKFRIQQNADVLVTGHYANIKISNKEIQLSCALNNKKDQSYFLCMVDNEILRHTYFPLWEYNKSDTRELAKTFGLHVSQKPDSQDVCFLSDTYMHFIKDYTHDNSNIKKGNIVDACGNILGEHNGVLNYTIGQRKGIPLGDGPYFVKNINFEKNELIVVKDKQDTKINCIYLSDVKFINAPILGTCKIKIRSSHNKISAILKQEKDNNDIYIVQLLEDEYAAATGQYCVFYRDDIIFGCGVIKSSD